MEFPSREFAEALCKGLNESGEYKRYARGWRWPILFKVEGGPGFILDLHEGECRGVKWFDDASQATADYVLSAPRDVWLSVIHGDLHPIRAILSRKIKLEKGSYTTLARYSMAATEIVRVARSVLGSG